MNREELLILKDFAKTTFIKHYCLQSHMNPFLDRYKELGVEFDPGGVKKNYY